MNSRFSFSLNDGFFFDATKSIQRDSGIELSKRLQVSDFRSNLRSKRESLLPAVSAYRSASKKRLIAPMFLEGKYDALDGDGDRYITAAEMAPRSLLSAGPIPLSPEMSFSVAQAIGKRWSRLERDIEKYNSQHHYGWGGHWNQWDSIDAQNLTSNWYGNQIDEILEGMEIWKGGEDLEFGGQQGQSKFDDISRRVRVDRLSLFSRSSQRSKQRIVEQLGFVVDWDLNGVVDGKSFDDQLEDREAVGDQITLPQMYVAASHQPIQSQPGMTAILAADHLSKRLDELERLASDQSDGLDKGQTAERRAIQIAIKKIEQVGARLEKNGQFWGYQGWSYRPRPQTINPPMVQAYSGSQWSHDLTRYAEGLYSNTNDMIEEVAQQSWQNRRSIARENRKRQIKF